MNNLAANYPERAFQGPLDVSEVRDLKPLHDFGSIRIPNRADLGVRLEVEETTGAIIRIVAEIAQSKIKFQAFAAPRNDGLWSQIRSSLAESITQQGGRATEQVGAFGEELVAMLSATANKALSQTDQNIKFIGVDGPRWFLRMDVTGVALSDPLAAAIVEDVIRGVVVNRGDSPMPPRELLQIIIPPGSAAAARV